MRCIYEDTTSDRSFFIMFRRSIFVLVENINEFRRRMCETNFEAGRADFWVDVEGVVAGAVMRTCFYGTGVAKAEADGTEPTMEIKRRCSSRSSTPFAAVPMSFTDALYYIARGCLTWAHGQDTALTQGTYGYLVVEAQDDKAAFVIRSGDGEVLLNRWIHLD